MIIKLIFFTLVIGLTFVILIPNNRIFFSRVVSLITSSIPMLLSGFLLYNFDRNTSNFQFLTTIVFDSKILNFSFVFGLDGLSIYFFSLSAFLTFLCMLFILKERDYKYYSILLLLIDLFLLLIFSTLDLMVFYIYFEAILIPMYLLIGLLGSRERKVRAAYLLFFYTLVSSLLMLLGIIYIYTKVGTLSLIHLFSYKFSVFEQNFLWCTFFFSFASKVPLFPFHIWLPEAHVEAPTVGSVLLAGILLKLGIYGFLRVNLIMFPHASETFSILIYVLGCIGIIVASINSIRQTDMKRMIAYSSIAHMNLDFMGLVCGNLVGIEGAIYQCLAHGIVSGGLFFLIGIIYSQFHSREILYYGGLVYFMPLYSIFFLLFFFANIAIPGTSNFVGELMLLIGIFQFNSLIGTVSSLGIILCGIYSLWLCNRILFGNFKNNYTLFFKDINYKQFCILFFLLFFVFLLGLYSVFILNSFHFFSEFYYLNSF